LKELKGEKRQNKKFLWKEEKYAYEYKSELRIK